jgi:hypothetical protein
LPVYTWMYPFPMAVRVIVVPTVKGSVR